MGNTLNGQVPAVTASYEQIVQTSPCPTCRGTGQVSTDSDSEYIALIPLTDRRLRPRRTTIKLLLTVLFCLTVSILTLFFLFPRSILLTSSSPLLLPSVVNITDDDIVSLIVSNIFNFSNFNFVPVNVRSISVLSLYHSTLINNYIVDTNTWISPRSTQKLNVSLSLIFDADSFKPYLATLCTVNNTAFNRIYINFGIDVAASLLGQRVESSLNTVQLVSCYPTSDAYPPLVTTSRPATPVQNGPYSS
uniref:Transmembrane protein 106A n=2 Tax=Schistocephalus solidus TaxID=70667 RepID=A0A0X3P0X5_SCHSO